MVPVIIPDVVGALRSVLTQPPVKDAWSGELDFQSKWPDILTMEYQCEMYHNFNVAVPYVPGVTLL